MTEERPQRRLAAILVADVVGYGRLMEVDEAGTLATLKHRRQMVLTPLLAKHGGRIIKFMGDGVLVEFGSAVNAVSCAVALQGAMAAANAGLPDEKWIVLRIGINLGDVIIEGGDLYGDGINVAARLEALAEPGGICVSDTVQRQVKGRIEQAFEDLGEQALKNMAEPVRCYRVAGMARVTMPAAKSAAGRPSIAVLPFSNMSGDPAQDYFSDGITEDIITELARYHSLSVIARNSAFQFRGPGVDLAAVRRILGVHYILEGSVRKAGTRVRVTAQLIDATTGSHLWAERYDRTIADVFAVQDEVVQTIVSTLEGRLAATAAAQVRSRPTTSWAAYDYFLQGRELSNRYRTAEADDFLARAIELDPGYVHAYAWRASTLVAKYWHDLKPETLRLAIACAEKALSLDESDAWCHQAMGFALLHARKQVLAGMHFERAMRLNPNDINVVADYANWLCYMGRFDECLRHLDLAMQRDPFPPSWIWETRGTALLLSKRYDEAIGAFQKAPTENFHTHALLAAAYAWAGQAENARHELNLARATRDDSFLCSLFKQQTPYADEAHNKHLLEGLRMAGLSE
ncbi:MAG TPA: adenylate/guanylate cyclase domain-containing protein [Dongiaceae bacterium]|jgi:TolB-like protein/Tfp pilus assembly protein PilF|nr:adenylate/guanylate cyclase domain-containing protein [Dongiaceae bacterium]HSE75711.1 adenylate/guanylate cyclase domain-containing protein [Dongiaceae bacterium]